MGVKPKRYPHFDWPLSLDKASNFSITSNDVLKHKFFPFLRYETSERRIVSTLNSSLELGIMFESKNRPISYACHNDSAIFSIFNKSVSHDYEQWLSNSPIDDCVLAYRPNGGTNIDASKDAFDEIRGRQKCVAIAADISSFFDNVPHTRLKSGLSEVTGCDVLPSDLYYIYRAITRYSYIEISEIESALGLKKLPSPICSYEEFRSNLVGLVRQSGSGIGIPQGSSLSGLFANIAMIEFDLYMSQICKDQSSSYRRYSDDICIICPTVRAARYCYEGLKLQADLYKMVVKDTKTQITVYNLKSKRKLSSFRHMRDPSGKGSNLRVSNSPFQYLGFVFDGEAALIRPSSIERYYKKMRKNLFRYIGKCKEGGVPLEELHLRGQYRRWTHQNKSRGAGTSGNFITYAYRAADIHDSLAIRRQVRFHVKKFKATIKQAVQKYY